MHGHPVNRSFVAAGDVVDVGDHVGGMSSWCCEVTCFVYFFLSFPIHRYFRSSEPCQVITLLSECLHLSQIRSGHLPISWLVFIISWLVLLLFFEISSIW